MKYRFDTIVSWVLKALLIITLPLSLWNRQYMLAFAAVLAIVLSFIPALLARNYNVTLPWMTEALITLALYLHIGGLVFDWYDKIYFWDKIAHFIGTATIALLGFMTVFVLHYTKKINVSIPMIGLFTFVFAVTMGVFWELGEFSYDLVFGTSSQRNLFDTNLDLFFNMLGGFITAGLGMWYLENSPEKKLRKQVARFLKRKDI